MLKGGKTSMVVFVIIVIIVVIMIINFVPCMTIPPSLQKQGMGRLSQMRIKKFVDFLFHIAVTEPGGQAPGQDCGREDGSQQYGSQ
jgi:hypothetical protein